jgi:hypothetical protein
LSSKNIEQPQAVAASALRWYVIAARAVIDARWATAPMEVQALPA